MMDPPSLDGCVTLLCAAHPAQHAFTCALPARVHGAHATRAAGRYEERRVKQQLDVVACAAVCRPLLLPRIYGTHLLLHLLLRPCAAGPGQGWHRGRTSPAPPDVALGLRKPGIQVTRRDGVWDGVRTRVAVVGQCLLVLLEVLVLLPGPASARTPRQRRRRRDDAARAAAASASQPAGAHAYTARARGTWERRRSHTCACVRHAAGEPLTRRTRDRPASRAGRTGRTWCARQRRAQATPRIPWKTTRPAVFASPHGRRPARARAGYGRGWQAHPS